MNTGGFALQLDLTMIPQSTGFVSAMAGDDRNVRAWHRDLAGGSATSSFANCVEISFNGRPRAQRPDETDAPLRRPTPRGGAVVPGP